MNKESLIETLREMRFLHDVGPMHLEQIAKFSRILEFKDGELVFRQGEPAQHVFLVVSGTVSLEICAAGSGCKQILTLGQGELVGWSSVLDQTYYTTRAHAIETTRLVEINAGQFLTMCERNPKFGFELMRRTALSIAKRLSATRIQLMDVYGGSLPVLPNEIEEGDGE